MKDETVKGYTLFILRVIVVFVFLWHGVPKAFNPSMAMQKFVGFGLPGFLGPVIGWVEVIAGVLILVGYMHKWSNYVLAAVMVGAIVSVQLFKGGVHAGLERDLLILGANLVLATHGPGAFALNKDP